MTSLISGSMHSQSASSTSSNGAVVVGQLVSNLGGEAFRWTAATGEAKSEARSVSRDGSVVVGTGDRRAFRWTAEEGINRRSCGPLRRACVA